MQKILLIIVILFIIYQLLITSDIPEYEFITEPFSLGETFYDYIPGCYCSYPCRKQPPISQPYGFPADGYFIVYHRLLDSYSNRRVYFSYLNSNDNLINSGLISSEDFREGFPGIYIDPVTANPMVAWHTENDSDYTYENIFSFNEFSINGNADYWLMPYDVIDNSDLVDVLPYQFDDDEYIWSYPFVGESPIAGKRRIYIYANNKQGHGPQGNPSESVLIVYADFDSDDIASQTQFEWNYRTIARMDQWNAGIPEHQRPFKTMAVKDNYVAFMGYKVHDEESASHDSLFVFLNNNYCEGEFEYFSRKAEWEQPDYQLSDGSWLFNCEMKWKIIWSGHMNLIFKNESNLSFIGNLSLYFSFADEEWAYNPGLGLIYPKEFSFNLETEQFEMTDLYPQGENPHDNIPMVPWDLDEDGEIDSLDIDEYPLYTKSFPVFGTDPDNGFHYNLSHITKNEENGWLAAVWSDAMKAYLAENSEDEYQTWNGKPELLISISNDNGENWSEPIRMHANSNAADGNFVTQFQNMIPSYVYPGDELEDLGNNKAKLPLFFYDDNNYGSYPGYEMNGGTLMFTSLEIDMDYNALGEEDVVEANKTKLYNYPNPFNPETTIYFKTLQIGKPAEIIIYNLKGQKVKSFKISNLKKRNSINWRGRDDQNKCVATGIYLYELNIEHKTKAVSRCLLMK